MCNWKDGRFDSVSQKRDIAGNLDTIDHHQTKIKPEFFCVFQEHMNRGECAYVVVRVKPIQLHLEKKLLRFQHSTRQGSFFVILQTNCLRVLIHFPIDRFTFRKIPPLTPLLNPRTWREQERTWRRDYHDKTKSPAKTRVDFELKFTSVVFTLWVISHVRPPGMFVCLELEEGGSLGWNMIGMGIFMSSFMPNYGKNVY